MTDTKVVPTRAGATAGLSRSQKRWEEMQIRVTPEVARALWSAVWALEDAVSVVRGIQQLPSPPPYVDAVLEQVCATWISSEDCCIAENTVPAAGRCCGALQQPVRPSSRLRRPGKRAEMAPVREADDPVLGILRAHAAPEMIVGARGYRGDGRQSLDHDSKFGSRSAGLNLCASKEIFGGFLNTADTRWCPPSATRRRRFGQCPQPSLALCTDNTSAAAIRLNADIWMSAAPVHPNCPTRTPSR